MAGICIEKCGEETGNSVNEFTSLGHMEALSI